MNGGSVLVRELLNEEKPREKFAALGPQGMTEVELLAILIRTGMKGKSVLEVSREVLQRLTDGGLHALGEASYQELMQVPGIGRDKAITICAAAELGRRIAKSRVKLNREELSAPEAVAAYVMEEYRHYQEERMGAAFLTVRNKLICVEEISRGSLDRTIVHPRDVG